MTPRSLFLALTTLFLVTSTSLAASAATRAERDAAVEAKITADVARVDAGAAAKFTDATRARDKGDLAAAATGFSEVDAIVRSAGVSHAVRRLCGVELAMHLRDKAVAHCREALAIEASGYNYASLANALVTPGMNQTSVSLADRAEAKSDALSAMENNPDDDMGASVLARVSYLDQDRQSLHRAVLELKRLDPDLPGTYVFAAFDAAMDDRWGDAEDEIARGRTVGLPAAEADRLDGLLDESQPLYRRWGRRALKAFGAWGALLALLFGLGALLSRATLGAARALSTNRDGHAPGASVTLRRAYRAVLWATCAFYYLSIPLLLATVVVIGGGLFLGLLSVDGVPIKLIVIVAIVTVASASGVVRGVFARGKAVQPGERLDLDEHPKLRALLDDVARAIGTAAVDAVYLTPATEIAVSEQGSGWQRLRGRAGERRLILGVGVLEGMRMDELASILGHEYGHFKNEDTAGGGFALAVRRSILQTAMSLAKSGVAAFYNPAWLFVRGYFALFLRVSQGASRLQEILADRWAALTYGSDAFGRGLRHVIARTVVFTAHAKATLVEHHETKAELENLYAFTPMKPAPADAIEQSIEQAIDRKPSPYDSHPSPKDRLAWVAALAADPTASLEAPAADAWDLFADRAAIEERMTGVLRSRLRKAA